MKNFFSKINSILVFIIIIISTISVFAINSSNYVLDASLTSSGGGLTTSLNYETNTILGTISGRTNTSMYSTYLGFFFGGGGSSQPGNSAPFIVYVSNNSITSGMATPTPGGTSQIVFWFTANDTNGAPDMVSATATFTYPGEATRQNISCTPTNNPGILTRNFSCSVGMLYYDAAANWRINVSIKDSADLIGYDDTKYFNYVSSLDINLSTNSITWLGLGANTFNNTATSPTNVSNIGNALITNISIKAFELLGASGVALANNNTIGAGNFSVTNQTGATPCILGSKDVLINNTEKTITSNVSLTRYLYGRNSVNLTYCLNIPQGLGTGIYNTTNQWVTKGCC